MAIFDKTTFEFKKWTLFCVVVLSYIVVTIFSNQFFLTRSLYLNTFSSQLSYDKIDKLLAFQQEWQWLSYMILPLWFLRKILNPAKI